MKDEDQKTRDAMVVAGGNAALNKAVWTADGRHLQRLKKIDKAQGFPTEMQVGAEGVDAAWILTQHAGRDRSFQAHVLGELKSRVHNGGVGAQAFTLLTDRVLVGAKQATALWHTVHDGEWCLEGVTDGRRGQRRQTPCRYRLAAHGGLRMFIADGISAYAQALIFCLAGKVWLSSVCR